MSQLSFHYKAIDAQGVAARGELRARDREEAYRRIVASGLKPLRITTRRALVLHRNRAITVKDLAHFTHQFAILMEARIPIVDGIRSIAEQEQNPRLRAVMEDVADQIEAGSSVTDALSPHRAVFGEVYVETVRAAEKSGTMIEVLTNLATMLERRYEMTRNVRGALMYPACVIVALTLAVTFLMLFVIPRFADMFASRGLELPLPTQFVIGVSTVLRTYWYLVLIGVVGCVWGLRRAWSCATSRRRIDTWLHRVPLMRDLLRGLAIGRFATVLGVSLRAGLSLIDALELAGAASGRPLMQTEAENLRDQVNLGGRLSDSILACQYVPPFMRRMIAAGEEAGELPRMCDVVARNYDRDVEHLTRNVTTLLEPILVAGLAGVVLIIALAIFLPMWNMAALLG
jgi:type II secretory pathway component PulF